MSAVLAPLLIEFGKTVARKRLCHILVDLLLRVNNDPWPYPATALSTLDNRTVSTNHTVLYIYFSTFGHVCLRYNVLKCRHLQVLNRYFINWANTITTWAFVFNKFVESLTKVRCNSLIIQKTGNSATILSTRDASSLSGSYIPGRTFTRFLWRISLAFGSTHAHSAPHVDGNGCTTPPGTVDGQQSPASNWHIGLLFTASQYPSPIKS